LRRLLPLLLLACAPVAAQPAPVALTLANTAGEALRCQVIYAHWVTGELPPLAPGGAATLQARRDPTTREVFVPRDGDGRRLMVEEILCGADADWSATLTHIDLEAVKRGEAAAFDLTCDLADRVACAPWQAR
jgi:hypothetical protein